MKLNALQKFNVDPSGKTEEVAGLERSIGEDGRSVTVWKLPGGFGFRYVREDGFVTKLYLSKEALAVTARIIGQLAIGRGNEEGRIESVWSVSLKSDGE